MSAIAEKTRKILTACKYAVVCAVPAVVLLSASAAGAAAPVGGGKAMPSEQVRTYDDSDRATYRKAQPYSPDSEGYVPTPIGDKSEAWGEGTYGPGHLRRMSPTEALPAEPQMERVVDLP